MTDPTYDEMTAFLKTQQDGLEPDGDDFDRAAAIYWFATGYHGGQASNLYSAGCVSQFSPGPTVDGPEPETSEEYLYQALVLEYAPDSEEASEITNAN